MKAIFYKAVGALVAPFRYAERKFQHAKEEAKEDIQAFIANAIKLISMGVAALLFLLFISIFLANVLNEALDSSFVGYAIVAGMYLLTAIGFYVAKEVSDNKRKVEENRKKAIQVHG
jgi:hypothetical protein